MKNSIQIVNNFLTKPEIKVARYDGFQIINSADAAHLSQSKVDNNFAEKYKNKISDDDIPF